MPPSPDRDPLRDAEARIRALTREVGSLREELRRETKRRERAVVQAKEAEEGRAALEHKAKELGYANRKLAAELDTAHDAARSAAERDRRALRTLREGLAAVEQEVSARGVQGQELVGHVLSCVTDLRTALLAPPGSEVLGPSLVAQVTHTVADAVRSLTHLGSLLTGAPSASAADGTAGAAQGGREHTVSSWGVQGPAAGGGGQGVGSSRMGAMRQAAADAEKEQLRDEVARLRSQLRAVVDKAAGAAGAASIELQALLRDSQSEAESLRGELATTRGSLAAAAADAEVLRREVVLMQDRLAAQESLNARATETAEQLAAVQQQLGVLNSILDSMRQENGALKVALEQHEATIKEQSRALAALKAGAQEQQSDMAAALRLVAESHTARARAAASAAAAAAATIATSVGSAPSYDRAQLLGRALTDQAPAGGELRGLVPAAPASQLNAASTAGTLHNISGTGAPVVAYNQGTTKSTAGALSGTSVLPSSAAPSAPAEPARASTSTVINPGAAAAAAAARHLLRSELPPVLEEPHMVLYPPSAPSLQGRQRPGSQPASAHQVPVSVPTTAEAAQRLAGTSHHLSTRPSSAQGSGVTGIGPQGPGSAVPASHSTAVAAAAAAAIAARLRAQQAVAVASAAAAAAASIPGSAQGSGTAEERMTPSKAAALAHLGASLHRTWGQQHKLGQGHGHGQEVQAPHQQHHDKHTGMSITGADARGDAQGPLSTRSSAAQQRAAAAFAGGRPAAACGLWGRQPEPAAAERDGTSILAGHPGKPEHHDAGASSTSSSMTSSSELSFVADPPDPSHKQLTVASSSLPAGSAGVRTGAGSRALVSDMRDLDEEIAAMERELSAAARSVGLHVA